MEFNEKLQELRKKKGITQEELSEALYVSRTAVSKWESGRGFPNIESLKAISKFFSVTIDELLSCDQVLDIAENDNRQKENHMRDLVFGLLDLSSSLFFFLPFFGQKSKGMIEAISLLSLTEITPWLKIIYFIIVTGIILSGIASLTFQNVTNTLWLRIKNRLSLFLNAAGIIIFTISSQPYAAVFLFIFMLIKVIMLIKR